MNIRRFVATDMREALSAIRADLGADAVMLSSRKLPQGVEVIAAIDYDDSLLAGSASRSMSAMDSSATADADDTHVDARDSAALADYERVAARLTAAPATPTPAMVTPARVEQFAGNAPVDESMAHDIKDLRRLLETQLASLAWNDLNRQAPVRARLLRELAKLGVDSVLATELADEVPADSAWQEAMRIVVRRFGERLPLATWDMADAGGIYAIVGPTGVGKTTSIAKIAARFVLRHSVEELGLVSTDTYRIGAR